MPNMMVSDWAYPMHGAWAAVCLNRADFPYASRLIDSSLQLCVMLYVVGFCLLPRQFAQERASKSEGAMGKDYVPLETGHVERGEGLPITGNARNTKVRVERGDAVSDNEEVRVPLLQGD